MNDSIQIVEYDDVAHLYMCTPDRIDFEIGNESSLACLGKKIGILTKTNIFLHYKIIDFSCVGTQNLMRIVAIRS